MYLLYDSNDLMNDAFLVSGIYYFLASLLLLNQKIET